MERQDSGGKEIIPFVNAQEAWFWYVQAERARIEGARVTKGMSFYPRPCEPSDIFLVIDRLYRNRRLCRDHLKVLRHYGVRLMAPDPRRVKEARAFDLWREAMDWIEDVLIAKGIVRDPYANVHYLNAAE